MKRLIGSRWFVVGAFLMVVAAPVQPGPAAQEQEAQSIEQAVRKAFDAWSEALTRGDKGAYLDSFWNSPRLRIRVANIEYEGLDEYRKRVEGARMPPSGPPDYRKVHVLPLGREAAVVTYERPAPAYMSGGHPILFVGTLVFTRTREGWKIALWQAHSERDTSAAPRGGH